MRDASLPSSTGPVNPVTGIDLVDWNAFEAQFADRPDAALTDAAIEAGHVLDPAVAALAAARATADQIAELQELVSAMAAASSAEQLARLDRRFHSLVADAAANRMLVSMLHSITAHTETTPEHFTAAPDPVTHAAVWTEFVVEAITNRDTAAAHDAMRMHLRNVHRCAGGPLL